MWGVLLHHFLEPKQQTKEFTWFKTVSLEFSTVKHFIQHWLKRLLESQLNSMLNFQISKQMVY